MFLRCTDILHGLWLHFVALHVSCCAWEFLFVLAVVIFVVSLFCGLFLFIGFKTSCQSTTVESKPAGKTLAHLQSCWLMGAVLLNKWKERNGKYTSLKGQAHCNSLFRVMPVLLIQGIGGFRCFLPGNCCKLYPVCKLFLSKQTCLNRVSEWPSVRRSSETGNNCWLLKNAQCAH